MPFLVEVNAISKKLGDSLILDGVNFALEEGRIYGLLGLNGAGKSTLLKILSGVLSKDNGTYLLDGKQFCYLDPFFQKKIGFLPEKIPVVKGVSVWDYLFFWAKVVGLSFKSAKEQITYLMHKLELDDHTHTSIDVLSKGYLQRVGVVTCVLGYPKLLLLDEPMSGLDPSQIFILRNFLQFLSRERNVTILISSHLLDEISRFCDGVVILSQKRIFLQGDPNKIGIKKVNAVQFDFEVGEQAQFMKKIAEEKDSQMLVQFIQDSSILITKKDKVFFSPIDVQSLLQYFWDSRGTGLLGYSSKKVSLQDIFLNKLSIDESQI